jgi:hypothetical protein
MADRNFKADSGNDLVLEDAGSTDRLRITDGGSTILYEDGGAAALTIDTDGDVNLTQDIYLASGKGIYFDGGTTSANYLGGSDAYEEGTWTPTYVSSAEGLSGVTGISQNNCRYLKIGSLVILTGQIIGSGSSSTPTGDAAISFSGLPFDVLTGTDTWFYSGSGLTRGALSTSDLINWSVTPEATNDQFYMNYVSHTGASADFLLKYTTFQMIYRN